MSIQHYDNFLDKGNFSLLQDFFLGPEVSWSWCENVVFPEPPDCNPLDNYQFYHMLFDDGKPKSESLMVVFPILDKLNSGRVIRVKANCNPRRTEHIQQGFHVDQIVKCTTAIYYVNTNNGYTEFEDGTKVESVENRLVVFPSHIKHTGTTCTDQKRRVVINLNYYG